MGHVIVVVGGQFGSEGKGEVAGYLSRLNYVASGQLVAVRVAGPNAGHTVSDPRTGDSIALRQLPVAAVTHPQAQLVIAAGSEVDPEVLEREIQLLDDEYGLKVRDRLLIDPAVTMIDREYLLTEQEMATQGRSTGKGIGAARAARLMRSARTHGRGPLPGRGGVTAAIIRDELAQGADVIVEGTQGYGLGLHTPYYPYTTSSDCRAIDFLAMAGLSPWAPEVETLTVWVVIRNRAIRIAGDSGPLDEETTWAGLGLEAELTTVTRKPRRIGGFMPELVRAAVLGNGGPSKDVKVAMTHLDHEFPELTVNGYGVASDEWSAAVRWLGEREEEIGARIRLVSVGPGQFVNRMGLERYRREGRF